MEAASSFVSEFHRLVLEAVVDGGIVVESIWVSRRCGGRWGLWIEPIFGEGAADEPIRPESVKKIGVSIEDRIFYNANQESVLVLRWTVGKGKGCTRGISAEYIAYPNAISWRLIH